MNKIFDINKGVLEKCADFELLDEELVIPEDVEYINNGIFKFCSKIKSIIFPSTLKGMDVYAFSCCYELRKIDLSKTNNLTISRGTFAGCQKLEEIIFPENINTIHAGAFWDCDSLKEINLKNTKKIGKIEPESFSSCANLKKITISKDNKRYSDMDCNVIYENKTNTLVQGCSASTIPRNTESIASRAFYNCNLDKELKLNKNLKIIEPFAFEGTNIKKLYIPESVEEINQYSFRNCKDLNEVYIAGKTRTSKYAFYDCQALKNVYCLKDISIFYDSMECKSLDIHCDITTLTTLMPQHLSLDSLIEKEKSFNKANKILKSIEGLER